MIPYQAWNDIRKYDNVVVSWQRCMENNDIIQLKLSFCQYYLQTSNISCTLVGNKIIDLSHVFGVSPVSAAPATSSITT